MKNKRKTGRIPAWAVALLIALPLAAGLFALCVGRIAISPGEVIRTFAGKISGQSLVTDVTERTLFNIRLPRILTALLVGAGLSVAGCSYQSLFANPLATPDTLGVAGGASFGAALGILTGAGMLGIQLSSFFFGGLAVALTYLAAAGRGRRQSRVVLSGIMISSLFSALVSLLKFVADEDSELPAITYWLMGSLKSAGYKNLACGAPTVIICVVVLILIRWRMNLLPLGEDEARSSGVNIDLLRGITVVCATLITASCVSLCGQVGWVGLLVPHVCRMSFGNDHTILVPASVSIGAAFMAVVDTLARSVSAADIPVSILTAVIGAPFFIIIMRRSGGWAYDA